jgi:hypothetical protein
VLFCDEQHLERKSNCIRSLFQKNATSSAGEKDQEAGWLLADAIVDEDADGVEPITEEEVLVCFRMEILS